MTHDEWERAIEPLINHCDLDLRNGGDRSRVLDFSERFARTVPYDVFVLAVKHVIEVTHVAIWPGIGQMEQALRCVGWQPRSPAAPASPRRRLHTVPRVEHSPRFYGELGEAAGGELGDYFKNLSKDHGRVGGKPR